MKSLVDGRLCLVTSDDGSFHPSHGLYDRDTRYLSALDVSFGDCGLTFVDRNGPDADRRTLVYVNESAHHSVTRLPAADARPPASLVLTREQVVDERTGFHERVTLRNHSSRPVSGTVEMSFDVDFADVFEVRGLDDGIDREIDVEAGERTVTYRYGYRDAGDAAAELVSLVAFDGRPDSLEPGLATDHVSLAPQETATYVVSVHPGGADDGASAPFDPERDAAAEESQPIVTGDRELDRTFERSLADLRALTTETRYGPLAVTGVPWYATVFGRDALVTAYQALPVAPALAEGTLRYLAARQGTEVDSSRDERPGKILHEVRQGELARRALIPHSPYYGTVDATPLWVVLFEETHRWLRDPSLVEELWGSFERALAWIESEIERFGDDPFLYYERGTEGGLTHQAWRDTDASVQFADGELARPPLASVEVQGYVYDALTRAARLYREFRDEEERAVELETRAGALRTAFDEAFWMAESGCYGAALTVDGRLVDSVTSNAGQCLWSGIVPGSRADALVDSLLSPDLFSGWGIRTMSSASAGYGPLAYHTGTVWPHDTSLVALGLARYGHHAASERVASGLLEATTHFEHNRLPELFGGFDDTMSPVPYVAACSPQSWAAAAPFALLRALFDVEPTPNGIGAGREPDSLRADAIAPLVEAWRGRQTTALSRSESEDRVYVL